MEKKSTRMKRPKDSECKSLVIRALQSGPRTGMKLTDIYDFVERNSSSTSTSPKTSWQKNVRFILSHYRLFVKSPGRRGFWIFNEELHRRQAEGKRRKAEEKRRKALYRSRIKAERRNLANQPAAQKEQRQQYPALASAINTTNQAFNLGKKPRCEIYAAQ